LAVDLSIGELDDKPEFEGQRQPEVSDSRHVLWDDHNHGWWFDAPSGSDVRGKQYDVRFEREPDAVELQCNGGGFGTSGAKRERDSQYGDIVYGECLCIKRKHELAGDQSFRKFDDEQDIERDRKPGRPCGGNVQWHDHDHWRRRDLPRSGEFCGEQQRTESAS
jgi:hypothetical protein